uniref:Uncharacterized protein n=1 Tax=Glossina brevipalpis TaxID=37001 RepID=A0A1A9WH62_9MUSC
MGDVQDGNVLANAKVLKSRSSPLEVPMGSEDNSVNNAKTYRYCKFETATSSLTSLQLSQGILEMYEPPLAKAKGQLKELIGKQNKIYIDLSAEKFKIDNAEVIKLQEMVS